MARRNTAIFLLSAAIIAYQLVLMQVLSIVQWHHLAFMVISTALLGFGAAGTFLSLYRTKLLNAYPWLFPCLMFLTSIGFAWAVAISQTKPFLFDLYLLFSNKWHVWRLLATYLLFFLPFFTGALAIGLSFVLFVKDIGRLYFANLVGSGAGGLLALALMTIFDTESLPAVVAIFPFLAGLLSLQRENNSQSKNRKQIVVLISLVSALALAVSFLVPRQLQLSQFKDLSKTMLLPEAKIELQKSSPFGLLQVVSSPVLRYAPGLSLNYRDQVPVRKVIFLNGNWTGSLAVTPKIGEAVELDYSTAALPWVMAKPEKIMIPGSATGEYVSYALAKEARQIAAVEANSELVDLLCDELALENDSLFHHENIHVYRLEPRTWLLGDTSLFDLILLPDVSSFGGNSGVQAMRENYSLTLEALDQMLRKLNPGGMISVTCWLDYPTRYPLKVLATFVESLERIGIQPIENHICAIRSWGTITFALKKEPFTQSEMDSVRAFCSRMSFDPALMPGIKPEERQTYNQLQDDRFFDYLDQLLGPSKDSLYRHYNFNIRPATDQRPFFSQFLKWRAVPQLAKNIGAGSVPFLELGYLMVVVTFIQISLVAVVLILLPLWQLQSKSGQKLRNTGAIIIYFGGIGVGFMFVEIVLIQQFTLFFGSPIYAAAAVITGLLIFSGLGSFLSPRFKIDTNRLRLTLIGIAALLFSYAFLLNPLLLTAATLPIFFKALMLTVFLFPLGFLMGLPFPTGLTRVSEIQPQATPWAWAVNGYFSVVSTALATITAVELGFSWVMALAAAAYLLAASALRSSFKTYRN